MKMLTKQTANGDYCLAKKVNPHEAIQRLAAYEITGLLPEQIKTLQDKVKILTVNRFCWITETLPATQNEKVTNFEKYKQDLTISDLLVDHCYKIVFEGHCRICPAKKFCADHYDHNRTTCHDVFKKWAGMEVEGK